jgi:hypothetical protein
MLAALKWAALKSQTVIIESERMTAVESGSRPIARADIMSCRCLRKPVIIRISLPILLIVPDP